MYVKADLITYVIRMSSVPKTEDFGAGMGADSMACFAVGTGICDGLVIDGRLHLGIDWTDGSPGALRWAFTVGYAWTILLFAENGPGAVFSDEEIPETGNTHTC